MENDCPLFDFGTYKPIDYLLWKPLTDNVRGGKSSASISNITVDAPENFQEVKLPFTGFHIYHWGKRVNVSRPLDPGDLHFGLQAFGGVYEEFKQSGNGSLQIQWCVVVARSGWYICENILHPSLLNIRFILPLLHIGYIAVVCAMDEDLSALPLNHPLRIYLRGLDLDDDDDFGGVDGDQAARLCADTTPSTLSNLVSGYALLFDLLSYYHNQHIFANDRAYLEKCRSDLKRQLLSCPLRPLPFVPILLTILPIFFALLVSNVSILMCCAGVMFFLFITAELLFTSLTVFLVKCAIGYMEDLHLIVKKSLTLLRGLNTVEIGYTFASKGGAFRNQLDRVVLPKYSSQLYDVLYAYVSYVSSLSNTINQIIQSSPSLVSSLVEIGSSLSTSQDITTDGVTNKKSLLNIKAMFSTALEFDSELARVFGCFVALHLNESVFLDLRIIKALCAWLWCQRRGRGHLRGVDQMRVNLEERGGFEDEPPSGVTKASSPGPEEVQLREHLSALTSLHYNVISLSCRLYKLRERVASKASSLALHELSSEDLQSMRILLTNCQYCLDEAEKTLRDEFTKKMEPIPVPKVLEPTSIVEGMGELIPLDSEQPPFEDECLEAIAGAEDPQAGAEDELYDDLDQLGQPVSKAEIRRRNADRAILLNELVSVIAHRMMETREREAKALSRSRGLLDSNPSLPSPLPSSPPPDVEGEQSMPTSNDGCSISWEETSRGPSLDMKKHLFPCDRNFHLVETEEVLPTQAQSDGTPRFLDAGNSEEDGGVIATEDLAETSIGRFAISADLKALILQRGQAVRSSKEEEIFDDFGIGEELNADELEGQ
ncbi:hypothetical protein TcWFU_008651 [Taenia crassiceps]|uniref:Vezatin n=1 Tax=Taenia crassiceps TaxID=6207 RepID=A0ABR4Q2L0_9CEST